MTQACGGCARALDPDRYARCDVCDGRRFGLRCAVQHFCTDQCPERGCLPGLCVRLVEGGRISERYGVEAV